MAARFASRSSAVGRDQIELPDALLSMASQAKDRRRGARSRCGLRRSRGGTGEARDE
eukprot:Skav229827  [mRNA]  locus=scaffold2672:268589:268759:+ [translate_table: standard]